MTYTVAHHQGASRHFGFTYGKFSFHFILQSMVASMSSFMHITLFKTSLIRDLLVEKKIQQHSTGKTQVGKIRFIVKIPAVALTAIDCSH